MIIHAKKDRFKLCKLHSNCSGLRDTENSHARMKTVNIFYSFIPEPRVFLFPHKKT